MWWDTLIWLVLILLIILNGVCVFLVVMQLPGTWIMLGLTGVVAWWLWDQPPPGMPWHAADDGVFGWMSLVIMILLAVLGEVVETAAGSMGAAKKGGSRRAMIGAILGGVVGAIAATFLIPLPILGTIIGAMIGSAAGSILGDLWAGKSWREAFSAGQGAAWGRLWGTLGKIVVAAGMWLVATVAIFWP